MSKVKGLIQETFADLLEIINDENMTNGFDTHNLKFKGGRKDIVVSLPEVNGHIIEARDFLIKEIERKFANRRVGNFLCSVFSLVELRNILIGEKK